MATYYNEIDPQAAQWLRNLIAAGHLPEGDVDTRSIEDVHPHELRGYTQAHFFAGIGGWPLALRLAGWPDDRPVWTGSCPCQPFSAAGARAGFDDERHLWPAWYWLIEQCRPPVVFGEQVASKAADDWLDLVQADLEALDYALGAVPFPSASVGAPHIRDRLYWVANALGHRLQGWVSRRADQEREAVDGSSGRGSATGRLADADNERRKYEQDQRPASVLGTAYGETEQQRQSGDHGASACRLADTYCDGRSAGTEPRLRHNVEHHTEPCGGAGGLADAYGEGSLPRAQRGVHSGEEGPRARHGELERQGATGGLADAAGFGRIGRRASGEGTEPGALERPSRLCAVASGRPSTGPLHGFWRDADWLACRDGKWRPVEPGTFPLAHGVPGRVVRLRAYGNAINVQQAAEFVRCTTDSN